MKEMSLRLYEKEPVMCKLQELFRSRFERNEIGYDYADFKQQSVV